MLCEVPKEIRSWILFIIGALCHVKLSLSELIDHLCAWVETFHVLFTIKARSNPRFPFKWEKNNGSHNFSRLAPVKLLGSEGDLSCFFPFKWLHFISSEFWRSRFTLLVSDNHGLIFNFALDSSRSLRHKKFSECGCHSCIFFALAEYFLLGPSVEGCIRILAFGPLLRIISLNPLRYALRSEVWGFNIVFLGRGLMRNLEWKALLYLIHSINFLGYKPWAPNADNFTWATRMQT